MSLGPEILAVFVLGGGGISKNRLLFFLFSDLHTHATHTHAHPGRNLCLLLTLNPPYDLYLGYSHLDGLYCGQGQADRGVVHALHHHTAGVRVGIQLPTRDDFVNHYRLKVVLNGGQQVRARNPNRNQVGAGEGA